MEQSEFSVSLIAMIMCMFAIPALVLIWRKVVVPQLEYRKNVAKLENLTNELKLKSERASTEINELKIETGICIENALNQSKLILDRAEQEACKEKNRLLEKIRREIGSTSIKLDNDFTDELKDGSYMRSSRLK